MSRRRKRLNIWDKGYLPFDKYMLELKDFFIKEGHEGEQEAELICKTIQMIIRTGGTYEHIRDVLEVGFMDFDYVSTNEKLRRQLLQRIDNVWGAYEYRDEAWAYDKRNCCGRTEEQYYCISGQAVRER